MNEFEINSLVNGLRLENKVRVVKSRICSFPDIKGARAIIEGNEDICILSLRRLPSPDLFSTECEEAFETVDDDNIKRDLRKYLLEHFGVSSLSDKKGGA